MTKSTLSIYHCENGYVVVYKDNDSEQPIEDYYVFEYDMTVERSDPKISKHIRTDIKAFRDLLYKVIDLIGPSGATDGFSAQTLQIKIAKGDEL